MPSSDYRKLQKLRRNADSWVGAAHDADYGLEGGLAKAVLQLPTAHVEHCLHGT